MCLSSRYESQCPRIPGFRTAFGGLTWPAQRNLNNAFAYDLVPSVSVIAAALKAARRVNDFPTAVRVFEGTLVLLNDPICSEREFSVAVDLSEDGK